MVRLLGRATVRAVTLAEQLQNGAAGWEGHYLQLGTDFQKTRSEVGALVKSCIGLKS